MNDLVLERYPFPSPNPHVKLYMTIYRSEKYRVKGLLAVPKKDGTYDGLLYLRGGIKNVGKVIPSRITQFSSEGFVVFAPFYRGNQGGDGDEDFGGEDRFDAFHGFEVLKCHPQVNPDRIHVLGFSRGGVMALFTAMEKSQVKSVVSWAGVSDMFLTYEERIDLRRMLKRVIGGTPWKYPENYRFRTPLYEIERMQAPLLIIHGTNDQHVSLEHALRLEKMAKEYGKSVETWYYDGLEHHFPPKKDREVVKRVCSWMKKI